jgi:hypothetical protein
MNIFETFENKKYSNWIVKFWKNDANYVKIGACKWSPIFVFMFVTNMKI